MRSQPAPMSAMTAGSRNPSAIPKRGSSPPGLGVWRGKGVNGGAGPVVGDWVGTAVGAGVSLTGGVVVRVVWVGVGGGGGEAHALSRSTHTINHRTRVDKTVLVAGEVQVRRHPGIQDLAVLRLGRQQPLVVDQPGLLFNPLVPAVGAGIRENDGTPLPGQRRLRQPRFALPAAAARHLDHTPWMVTIGDASERETADTSARYR